MSEKIRENNLDAAIAIYNMLYPKKVYLVNESINVYDLTEKSVSGTAHEYSFYTSDSLKDIIPVFTTIGSFL